MYKGEKNINEVKGETNKALSLLFIIFGVAIFFISFASALDNHGVGKQASNFTITKTCINSTYVTISSIQFPNRSVETTNTNMTLVAGQSFQYNFTNTNAIGRYDVTGITDGCENTFEFYFEISPNGFINSLGLYLVLILILMSVIILGFGIKEHWFVVIGGLGLIILGVYSLNNGIVDFRDNFMTYTISLIEIGVGTILSVGAAIQKIDYD